MKEIIVKPQNADKIEKALAEANGKAKTRVIIDYEEVEAVAKNATIKLKDKQCLAKTDMEGVEVEYTVGTGKYPNAYQYVPMGTKIKLRFSKGNWRLVDAWRENCNVLRAYRVTLTPVAEKAIIDRIGRGFIM